jgi:hypothetical protein
LLYWRFFDGLKNNLLFFPVPLRENQDISISASGVVIAQQVRCPLDRVHNETVHQGLFNVRPGVCTRTNNVIAP